VKYPNLNIKLIAMISFIELTYFVVIIIVMHKLRPDYNPKSRYISEYAVGKYGLLAASSFVAFGLAILEIYLCLQTVLPIRVKSNIGLNLMAIWGVATVITGFFKVDLKNEQMSLPGTVHIIASGIGVTASTIGLLFLAIDFARYKSTQSIGVVTQMIAIPALILAAQLFLGLLGDIVLKYHHNVSGILLVLHNLTGLIERLLIGISIVWIMVIVNYIYIY